MSSDTAARLYHLRPNAMRGTDLLPLAELATWAPDLHAAAMAKYVGRAWLPRMEVPALGCRRCDVVFLSALSPRLVFTELIRLGRRGGVPSWFAIPAERLRGLPAVAYDPPGRLTSAEARDEAMTPFDAGAYRELTALPAATRIHLRASFRLGRRPFLFHRVRHVLVRGVVDVADVPIEALEQEAG